jgi:putative glycosyltransferase
VPFHERTAAVAREMGAELELIYVNDGSPDNGLEVARRLAAYHPEIVVIDLSRNFGQARALWAGIQHATGDLVAMFDGDMEEDPGWLKQFHDTMVSSRCDVVYGIQIATKGNPAYRAGRRFFYRALNILAADEFPRNSTTARLMTRRYVDALLQFGESEFALFSLMHLVGFAQIGVKVEKVSSSPTTYTFGKLVWLFVNAVTSFSTAPLLFIFICGVSLSIGAGLFVLYLLITLKTGVPGWLSVMAAITFFSGIIVLFLGVIAIYIGTIFLEVKRRPVTIVREIVRHGDQT